MQTNPPKEPQPPNRERPLQKSMFLPDQYPPQTYMHSMPQQNPGEFPQYNPMKRSLLQNTAINAQSPQYQFRTQNNQSFTSNSYQQSSVIQGQYLTLEQRTGTHHEILHHSNSLNNIKQASMIMDRNQQGNMQSAHKNFSRVDKQPISQIKTAGKPINLDSGQQQKIIAEIVNQIKQKHLPSLFNIVKKQLHDELHTFKAQLNQFKEEFKNHIHKQEAINNQLRNGLNRVSTIGNGRDKSPISYTKEKDNELAQLQKELFLLEGRLNKLQGTTSQNFTFFGEQLDKLSHDLQQKHKNEKNSFKISNIRSSLSAVMLEYKQLFFVKKTPNQLTKRTEVGEEEIVLSTCQYFVDRQGFLMDHENHYLLDLKGIQIRLEEKHIKILQSHKILHR